jgi:hypothetical protein
LDYDSQAECILANNQYFAIIEQDGARLTHLFYLNETGPHQLVAPSSQFSVGLSDPSEWHPERGEAGDPSVIPGAFTDNTDTWVNYNDDTTTNSITLATLNQRLIKTYRLTESSLEIVYQTNGPVSTRIPLVVDPQAFYFGPSDYQAMLSPYSWTWGLAGSSNVEVRTDADLSAQGFSSSFPFLSLAEDPNLDYPAGHYFPFPLSVATLHADGNFRVQISIK